MQNHFRHFNRYTHLKNGFTLSHRNALHTIEFSFINPFTVEINLYIDGEKVATLRQSRDISFCEAIEKVNILYKLI